MRATVKRTMTFGMNTTIPFWESGFRVVDQFQFPLCSIFQRPAQGFMELHGDIRRKNLLFRSVVHIYNSIPLYMKKNVKREKKTSNWQSVRVCVKIIGRGQGLRNDIYI